MNKLPNFAEMKKRKDAKDLSDACGEMTPANKAKMTKFIKEQIEREVEKRTTMATEVERERLTKAVDAYGGNIGCFVDDINRVQMCIHPDRPQRSKERLIAAWNAFERLQKPILV